MKVAKRWLNIAQLHALMQEAILSLITIDATRFVDKCMKYGNDSDRRQAPGRRADSALNNTFRHINIFPPQEHITECLQWLEWAAGKDDEASDK